MDRKSNPLFAGAAVGALLAVLLSARAYTADPVFSPDAMHAIARAAVAQNSAAGANGYRSIGTMTPS